MYKNRNDLYLDLCKIETSSVAWKRVGLQIYLKQVCTEAFYVCAAIPVLQSTFIRFE